ncbi:MAG: hypothetical protein AAFN93_22230 [Bacteroidota bacterium]
MFEFSFNDLKNPNFRENFLEYIERRAQKVKIYTVVEIVEGSVPPIARYKLSSNLQAIVGEDVANYLTTSNLLLDHPAHEEFTISKVFNDWPECGKHLEPISLAQYFGVHSHTFDEAVLQAPPAPENFKKVEEHLIDKIVDTHVLKEGYYLPVPYAKEGKLLGITYLIYDMEQLDAEEKKILADFRQKLQEYYV